MRKKLLMFCREIRVLRKKRKISGSCGSVAKVGSWKNSLFEARRQKKLEGEVRGVAARLFATMRGQ